MESISTFHPIYILSLAETYAIIMDFYDRNFLCSTSILCNVQSSNNYAIATAVITALLYFIFTGASKWWSRLNFHSTFLDKFICKRARGWKLFRFFISMKIDFALMFLHLFLKRSEKDFLISQTISQPHKTTLFVRNTILWTQKYKWIHRKNNHWIYWRNSTTLTNAIDHKFAYK